MGGKSLLEVLAADSAKSKNFRFGRDYYIKNAAKSAGARSPSKVLAESEVTEFPPTSNGSDINSEDIVTVVTAVPAFINSEESNELESLSESPTKPIAVHDVSSDSDLSIERIYNLQSGKVFEKKGNVEHEISTKDPHSPEGLKYVPKEFDEEVASRDENYNNTSVIQSSKKAFMRSLTQDDDIPEAIKNDLQRVEETLPDSEEELVNVPYDESKFKETLDIFNDPRPNVTNKHNPGKLVVAHNLLATSEVIKAHTAKILNEVENHNIKSYVVIETPYESSHSFGEAKKLIDNKINASNCSEEETSDKRDFSLEYSTDLNEDEVSRTESSLETDPEIIDLKEKRLVKDLLGKFSKSYPSISVTSVKQVEERADVTEDVECSEDKVIEHTQEQEIGVIPSVKNLKQLFDKENSNSPTKRDSKQIYSLTARSLSMQFRQKLKSDDEASLPSEENTTIEKVADEEIEEILPLDITKNRIAFFEHLGNK